MCYGSLVLAATSMRRRRSISLESSPLSQNQALLIMPHGRLVTVVGPQVECIHQYSNRAINGGG
jgi:hypothetical protein